MLERGWTPAELQLSERDGEVLKLVMKELRKAQRKHPPMCSPHHGYGVLAEELHEVFEAICENDVLHTIEEVAQLAASSIRFLLDDPFGAEAQRREEWEAICRRLKPEVSNV